MTIVLRKSGRLLKTIIFRYRQFGGIRVALFYLKRGALFPMIGQIIRNPFVRQSYKKAYAIAISKMEPYLHNRYSPFMWERRSYYQKKSFEHNRSSIIWFCWLQGLDNTPKIIKACYNSIRCNLPGRDIRVIDEENWNSYVDLPGHIINKWKKKQIPPALFSDLLRLQLLIKYGGTWMDSTVLCTGLTKINRQYTENYLDTDLFMFQYTRPGSNRWGGISNWFITSCTNNEVLMVLRDMLYEYWKDFDFLIDYYMFHLFFSMLREAYPREIDSMPYGFSIPSLTLLSNWGKKYEKVKWERLTSKVCFHKLAYTVRDDVERQDNNYYNYILHSYN